MTLAPVRLEMKGAAVLWVGWLACMDTFTRRFKAQRGFGGLSGLAACGAGVSPWGIDDYIAVGCLTVGN